MSSSAGVVADRFFGDVGRLRSRILRFLDDLLDNLLVDGLGRVLVGDLDIVVGAHVGHLLGFLFEERLNALVGVDIDRCLLNLRDIGVLANVEVVRELRARRDDLHVDADRPELHHCDALAVVDDPVCGLAVVLDVAAIELLDARSRAGNLSREDDLGPPARPRP